MISKFIQSKLGIKKQNYDVTKQFQNSWAPKLSWAKLCLGSDGNLHIVKCNIFSEVEGKHTLLALKWDSFYKHASCKKVHKNIGNNVKKGDWYYSKVFRHAKNQKLFTSYNSESVINQFANGKAKKKARKVCNLAQSCIHCDKDVSC
jgi:hypothetical protein